MLLKIIARSHSIPIKSFKDYVYGRTLSRRREKNEVLIDKEENDVVNYLLEMQNHGFPLHLGQLRAKVYEITQARLTPFKDGVSGYGWLRCFLNRHLELSLRKPQAVE